MELGRLEELDVRTAWGNEAHDFTPWLLEHGDHLAETLGIDVELAGPNTRLVGSRSN